MTTKQDELDAAWAAYKEAEAPARAAYREALAKIKEKYKDD